MFKTDRYKKLAERLKKGDERALSEIIGEFTPFVATIIRNISNGQFQKEDTEEVITDVFLTLWRNADKLETDMLKPYIICIAKSHTKDRLRKQKANLMSIEDIQAQAVENVFDECENNDLYKALEREVENIPEPDREILIRYYYYYQSVGKIAEVMKMSAGTVKSKLHRTRQKLKKAVIDEIQDKYVAIYRNALQGYSQTLDSENAQFKAEEDVIKNLFEKASFISPKYGYGSFDENGNIAEMIKTCCKAVENEEITLEEKITLKFFVRQIYELVETNDENFCEYVKESMKLTFIPFIDIYTAYSYEKDKYYIHPDEISESESS